MNLTSILEIFSKFYSFKKKNLLVGPIWLPIFFLIFNRWTRIGCRIDPGMALNIDHFHLVFWIRQDSNPQRLDCELSLLTTRLDLRPSKILFLYLWRRIFFNGEKIEKTKERLSLILLQLHYLLRICAVWGVADFSSSGYDHSLNLKINLLTNTHTHTHTHSKFKPFTVKKIL